jgi:hypothetical protein
MPTSRRAKKRSGKVHISQAVIDAYRACDVKGLYSALGIGPWSPVPLPTSVTALGCDVDDTEHPKIARIHRELLDLVGPPDEDALRREYAENLADDERYLAYLKTGDRRRTVFPKRAEEEYAEEISGWEKRVAWRRELLEGLPCQP